MQLEPWLEHLRCGVFEHAQPLDFCEFAVELERGAVCSRRRRRK
jgi:hypothetical protein